MDLSIIIVNWNTKDLLRDCLDSIYKETKNINFETFVVDNASQDKSAQMVRKNFPQVRLIQNQKNVGFSCANNQAVKLAKGKYILVLNSDTIILERALERAVQIINGRPEIGILAPKTLNKDGSIQKTIRSDPKLLTQLFFPTKIKKIFPHWKALKEYYCDDFDYEKESEIKQAQGSFLLIKRGIIEKIGLFDEKFFIWFEEVDFCLRARKASFKILYSPDLKIIHYGGESFSQINTIKKQVLYSRSLLYYFYKNKPKWQFFVLYLFKFPILIAKFQKN